MEQHSLLVDLNADIFQLLVEELLDEEDPALVSISNKNMVIMRKHFPEMLAGDGPEAEYNDPPVNLFHENEEILDLEPPNNIKGFNRNLFGYHHLLKLRSLCKSIQKRIDKLDLVSIRKQLQDFFSQKIASHPHRPFITLGIQSELQIAELKQKWPRILLDYLKRSNEEENRKKMIESAMNGLYTRAKFIYNERTEDHNGEIYGKASLLELEFSGQDNDPMKIQVKLVHCFDARESNWYTQIFIYALNSKHPANHEKSQARPAPDPVNCLLQVWKDRGWMDLTYYNPTLTQSVCQELSLDTALWVGADQSLLLEFFLLVAGEPKFTHFVTIGMKNDRRDMSPFSTDLLMEFEHNRTPTDNSVDYLTVIDEFKQKFLGTKIPKGKQGQRYLLNAKIQLGVSNLEADLMKSDLKIVPFLDSISACYDYEITPGEFAHINAFNLKATIKTNTGGLFVAWAVEKAGMGYHSPCEYIALIVMPLNQISAHALGVEIDHQAVVYYHFFERQYVINKELCDKLLKHWPIIAVPENDSEAEVTPLIDQDQSKSTYAEPDGDDKKRKAIQEPGTRKLKTKRARKVSPPKDGPKPERNFAAIFSELLRVRTYVPKRMGAFKGTGFSYFAWAEEPGFTFQIISKDWK